MRYALVSDLHANEQAWKTVLLDIRSLRVDIVICLGDVVGMVGVVAGIAHAEAGRPAISRASGNVNAPL